MHLVPSKMLSNSPSRFVDYIQHIYYKIGLLGYKAKRFLLPPYLLELLSECQPAVQTSSVII